MAKKVRREWTRNDTRELKTMAKSKSKSPQERKISKRSSDILLRTSRDFGPALRSLANK